MRKIQQEKLDKITGNDDGMKCIDDFLGDGMYMFLFGIPTGADAIQFSLEPPPSNTVKKKVLLITRARPPPKSTEKFLITEHNVDEEVIFMEINK